MRISVLTLVFILAMPIGFSAGFSRLYSQDLFLFFTAPSGDDEGYFDHVNVWFGDHRYSRVRAPDCRVHKNIRGIGSALLWSPGYLIFKYAGPCLKPALGMRDMEADQWLRLGAATTNFFIASALLWLLFSILRSYVGPPTALVFSMALVFGGVLPYYLFRRPLMSHGAEAFFFLFAVYGIERLKHGNESPWIYGLIGTASAGVLSTRLQDLPVIAVLLVLLAWERRRQWPSLAILFLVFFVSMVPQMVVNRINLGYWIPPPSHALSFLTPGFLFQLGWAQGIRLGRLFAGPDWGLILMFPWLLFALFVPRQKWRELWPVSRIWLLAPLPSLLIDANWIGHGGSYAHRYVSLFVLALGVAAACGFESLMKRHRGLRLVSTLGLGAALFISLTHFVAFESDESRLTLVYGPVSMEGPVRPEWAAVLDQDYLNGRYSANVYELFIHPRELVRCFGAAPLPLYAVFKLAELRHRAPPPAVGRYLDKHRIDFRCYWRYFGSIVLANVLLGWLWIQGVGRLRARRNTLSPGSI
ncbi:MAG: hypothetical protein WC859_02110 [Elusimicrobiota bacterium]